MSTQPEIYCEECGIHHLPGDHLDDEDLDDSKRGEVYYTARRDILKSMFRWGFGALALIAVMVMIPYLNNRINNLHHLHEQQARVEAQLIEQEIALRSQQIATAKDNYQNCLATRRSRMQGNQRARVLREFLLTASDGRMASAKQEISTDPAQAEIDLKLALRYHQLRSTVHLVPLPKCQRIR